IIKQKRNLSQYSSIIDVESEQERIRTSINQEQKEAKEALDSLNLQQSCLNSEISDAQGTLTNLKDEITVVQDSVEIQSFGLYEPKYDFGTSAEYKDKLDEIRTEQKNMIKYETAIVCTTEWTVNNRKSEGQRMTKKNIKLMARAFNGECDSIISKVRYNNYYSIEKRIQSVYKAINKLGESNACSIQEEYLNLKLNELRLVHEYAEKRQIEMEEQRRIREQIRDEERALREIEKAKQEVEKEEQRYQKALDKARQEIEEATGARQDKLQSEIERLNELLLETQANKERAMSRAQMTKSGHVYVISNIGSFGENVYKIGMTRRLEPTDRVRELGDASVPFRFDIHAMIYSENAPELENEIHRVLEKRSVNRINTRKEFFNVSLDEIENIVTEQDVNAEFVRIPDAKEFRETQLILAAEMEAV
ncbi:DUF4041 domain-containing protein, partial [Candidatus Poribacteria bacterium]|nr:DUF4041 domain-containing protein [Candidatus Poribacteria bacterium]